MTNKNRIVTMLCIIATSMTSGCADYIDSAVKNDDEIDRIIEQANRIRKLGVCLGGDGESCEDICSEGSSCQVEDRFQLVQETLVDTNGY